jgi:hypothetical protein
VAYKSSFDWEAIERDYRAGLLSVHEIARQHGCSGTAIGKRAKAGAWQRDLTAKVQERFRVKVAATKVDPKVSEAADRATENLIIEEASDRAHTIVEGHLSRAKRLTALVDRTLGEIEAHYGDDPARAELARLYLFPTKGDSLTGHLRTSGDLIERVTRLERTALNLDVEQGVDHEAEIKTLAERLLTAQQEMEGATVVHPEQADAALDADAVPPGAAGLPGEPA